ncbi:MAG: hypothetical protein QJR14_06475 [Bacillota bacterium]|nr:hypothetical protein [Bacillota bacterium]
MLATFSAFLDWWFSSPVVMNTVATVAVLSILLYGLLELTAGGGSGGTF